MAAGDVLAADLVGNDPTDAAAGVGGLRQSYSVINARRNLLKVRRYWYSIMLNPHKF